MNDPEDLLAQARDIVAEAKTSPQTHKSEISNAVSRNLERFLGLRRRGMSWREIAGDLRKENGPVPEDEP